MSSTSPQRRTSLPRFAEAAVDRARLSVVPRLRTRAPRIPFVTLVSLILLAGVVGLLLFNTSMQQASFTASKLEDQASSLSARQEALAMELDQLRDPQRLAAQACALGMVVGPTAAFLDVETGALTGTPTAAVAGPCGFEPMVRPVRPVPEDVPVLPGQRSGAAQGRTQGSGR
ncbi:hypothetical protein [Nocardioides sp.]|jgi:outer membrane murein-binding lipoprotein Lpp|uniref:hypothetical protein n=1 Tax=Nocardioides sp. TaxID=35761 RepID=UPI0026219A0F|nr:hypothetical protein [Nocardioides sp.]